MQEHLSIEELVAAAKTGSTAAMEVLMERMYPLITRRAHSFSATTEQDRQDLVQEGMIAVLNAVRHFRQDSGAAFKTFAYRCAVNRMLSVLRSHHSRADVSIEACVSDDELLLTQSESIGPEEQFVAKDEADRIFRTIEERLSVFEKNVILLYISGQTYSEIAAALSSNFKAVDNALQRVRRKLK